MEFDVPETAKKMVWRSAGQKWRKFKCRLTTHYVLPYRDQLEVLNYPPADYSFIEKAHWDMFVAHRLSDEFNVSFFTFFFFCDSYIYVLLCGHLCC